MVFLKISHAKINFQLQIFRGASEKERVADIQSIPFRINKA